MLHNAHIQSVIINEAEYALRGCGWQMDWCCIVQLQFSLLFAETSNVRIYPYIHWVNRTALTLIVTYLLIYTYIDTRLHAHKYTLTPTHPSIQSFFPSHVIALA